MIKSLTLTNFRNHETLRIITAGHKNIIITGSNGAGKSAILEAVSLLGGDRGMRAAPMTEIARFSGGGDFSAFANLSDDTNVSVYFNAGDANRHAKISGEFATLSDLSKYLRIVWITPKEDRLFLDSVSDRRAYFDRLVAGSNSAHLGRVGRLSKLLSERAFALKNGADINWIDALDVQIAAVSVAVASSRLMYASEINYFLSGSAVSVSGLIETWLMDGNAGDAEKTYLAYLTDNRKLQSDKMTIDGAHKSDFGVYNILLSLPANLTSTGQQKSVLVDLILAHARLVKTKTGITPVVLLDEADAHLDPGARARMFLELSAADAMVWATGIDAATFKNVPDALFVSCAGAPNNNIIIT